MTKREFLDKMREALSNDLAEPAVRENIEYYDVYMTDEIERGRSEEELVEEMGDPWMIARTIIDISEPEDMKLNYVYEEEGQSYNGRQDSYAGQTGFFVRGGWKLVVALLGLIGVLLALVAVVGGIISLVAPILVPVLIIMFVIRLLGRRK
ncbi:hypothetical protein C818_03524 [Lachnospiraceae bacterium MD308]|jgi:Predicted membrane protein|nr:hypothetical protein C818_03524 [Lachnospiraceae bacterium MD308]